MNNNNKNRRDSQGMKTTAETNGNGGKRAEQIDSTKRTATGAPEEGRRADTDQKDSSKK